MLSMSVELVLNPANIWPILAELDDFGPISAKVGPGSPKVDIGAQLVGLGPELVKMGRKLVQSGANCGRNQ